MARYFFDLADGNSVVKDRVGLEFTDFSAAREGATALAVDKASENLVAPEEHDARELHIRSGKRCVAKLAFRYISA